MSKIDVSDLEKEKSRLCLSCLECCKWLRFDCGIEERFMGQVEEMTAFYQMRGCRTRVVRDVKGVYLLCVLIPQTCKYLTPKGCRIYPNRPDACKRYDGTKDIMMADLCKWRKLKEA